MQLRDAEGGQDVSFRYINGNFYNYSSLEGECVGAVKGRWQWDGESKWCALDEEPKCESCFGEFIEVFEKDKETANYSYGVDEMRDLNFLERFDEKYKSSLAASARKRTSREYHRRPLNRRSVDNMNYVQTLRLT